MRDNLMQEIGISAALVALLILLLNPLKFWMPSAMVMMMVVGLAVLFVVFASFIWRENARDEREGMHRMIAGRFAFLTGAGVLVAGIILQSFRHALDAWLVLALGAMIIAKIIGLMYSRVKH